MGWGGGCTSDDAGAPEVDRVYGDYGHLLFQGLESNVCVQNVSTPTPSLSGGGGGVGGVSLRCCRYFKVEADMAKTRQAHFNPYGIFGQL